MGLCCLLCVLRFCVYRYVFAFVMHLVFGLSCFVVVGCVVFCCVVLFQFCVLLCCAWFVAFFVL